MLTGRFTVKRTPVVELITFTEAEAEIEGGTGGGVAGPVAEAARVLHGGDVLQLRIEPRGVTKPVAIERARAALEAIRRTMVVEHGLPAETYLELDDESYGTPVAPFQRRRFLLPHQDGGHCSFLTPSRLDCPGLDVDERVFSNTVYWKRPSHKMFQGFIITHTGEPRGTTYYYNTLTLLWDAFRHRHGRAPSGVGELAEFNLDNLRRSRAEQSTHRSRYVTLGALLGSPELAHHVMPSGPRAESELWPEQYANLPELCSLADHCPCGGCRGPGERLFCHASKRTLGRTWPEFRAGYEVSVVGELHDVMVGNNLTQLHAAESDATRTIRPLCLVLDRPDSAGYERWLAEQWRIWFAPPGHRAAGEEAA